MQKIVEQQWDYTQHAKFYSYRPNYAPKSLDMLALLAVQGAGADSRRGGGRISSCCRHRRGDGQP